MLNIALVFLRDSTQISRAGGKICGNMNLREWIEHCGFTKPLSQFVRLLLVEGAEQMIEALRDGYLVSEDL